MTKSKGKIFTDNELRFFILGYLMSGPRTLEDIHEALCTAFHVYIIDRPEEEMVGESDLLLPILRVLDRLSKEHHVFGEQVEVLSKKITPAKFLITLYRIPDSIVEQN